jgi:hypothetical protein
MKKISLFLTLFAWMAVAAFAADSGSGKIHLDSAVKVGSDQLPAGDYKVSWTGTGDNAQVTLTQGKVKATTSARVVAERRKSDAVGTKTDNGSLYLTEIQFKDTTLVLTPAQATSAGR